MSRQNAECVIELASWKKKKRGESKKGDMVRKRP